MKTGISQSLVLVLPILQVRQLTHVKTFQHFVNETKIRKCGPYFIQRGFNMWNWKKIQGANLNKVTTFGNIPTKILK